MYNILYLPLLQYCFKFISFDGLLLFVAVSLDGFICFMLSASELHVFFYFVFFAEFLLGALSRCEKCALTPSTST